MEIEATPTTGYLQIGETRIPTTGVLGRSTRDGVSETRAFPAWATLPSDYNLALAPDAASRCRPAASSR